eukprot:974308-Amphidinium_carterae.1
MNRGGMVRTINNDSQHAADVLLTSDSLSGGSCRLYERGLQTNGMVFGMLLEASRDIWQPELFPRPRPQKAQGEPDGSPQAKHAAQIAH